jgi:hypothetical protein
MLTEKCCARVATFSWGERAERTLQEIPRKLIRETVLEPFD